MNRSQLQDMLGGAVVFGATRKAKGIARFWRPAEPHLWCAVCTRTFPNGVHRFLNGREVCPYADCPADLAMQAYAWSRIRSRHPNYPATPSMAVQYVCERPVATGASSVS